MELLQRKSLSLFVETWKSFLLPAQGTKQQHTTLIYLCFPSDKNTKPRELNHTADLPFLLTFLSLFVGLEQKWWIHEH